MKNKKIAKAKLHGHEVIYSEVDDAFIKEFLGKEEKIVLKDKNALFNDWDKLEVLYIFIKEYTMEYLQIDFKDYEYFISTPK